MAIHYIQDRPFVHVICTNDYPWAVCPKGTTLEKAKALASRKMSEFNTGQNTQMVYTRVQTVPFLSLADMESAT